MCPLYVSTLGSSASTLHIHFVDSALDFHLVFAISALGLFASNMEMSCDFVLFVKMQK